MTTAPLNQDMEQQVRPQRRTGGKKAPSVYLWNPVTIALLSLLFTSVFGSVMHMLNWHTLEQAELARQSLWWALAGAVILLGNHIFSALLPEAMVVDTYTVSLLVLYVGSWFILPARSQVRYVREQFAKGYGHKSWKLVLPLALAGCLGYVLLGFLLAYLADLIR